MSTYTFDNSCITSPTASRHNKILHLISALCLWLAVSLTSDELYASECLTRPDDGKLKSVNVDRVIDGDTILLRNDQSVRLVGINTPEMARPERYADYIWQRHSQPQAQEAKEALIQLIAENDVKLYPSVSGKDHYDRILAHLFTERGNLAAILLRKGFGFALAMAPNLAFSDCYFAAEQEARDGQLGVWAEKQLRPVSAIEYQDDAHAGFAIIHGMVTRVSKSKGRVWLNIDDSVAVMIGKRHLKAFVQPMERYEGHNVELRGWVIDRQKPGQQLLSYKKRWLVSVTHPAMLRILTTETK